jgi:hypothetical protein
MMHDRICTCWANTVEQCKSVCVVGTGKPTVSHYFQRRKNLGIFDSCFPKRQSDTHEDNADQDESAANEVDTHTRGKDGQRTHCNHSSMPQAFCAD